MSKRTLVVLSTFATLLFAIPEGRQENRRVVIRKAD